VNTHTKSTSAKLVELTATIETLGTLVTTQMIRTFCAIAMANEAEAGVNLAELGNRLGLASSTRTRVVQALSVRRGGDGTLPGLDLVMTAPDPDDSRALLVFLTPRGRRFWATMKNIIE
jgi:DNA-binding MarR family transcriptional regulator